MRLFYRILNLKVEYILCYYAEQVKFFSTFTGQLSCFP